MNTYQYELHKHGHLVCGQCGSMCGRYCKQQYTNFRDNPEI